MIYLDKRANKPLYEQLYEDLREDIIQGTLKKNTALSSVRVMAKELQVSRNTIDRAYQQLLAEGYIRSIPGSGYYIEDISNEYFNQYNIQQKKQTPSSANKFKERLSYDFEYSSIDSDMFPWEKWRKYMQNAILEEASYSAIPYEINKGSEALRRSLCRYLEAKRGVKCKPEQVIICAGTQFAIDIVTNLLSNKEYQVAYEEPGYDAMRKIFLQKGYDLTTISVLEDGIDIDALEASPCNLLYITPSHQFPTGVVTSITKRNKILRWADQKDAYIIENDYDSEFRYGTMPIPALQSLDTGDRVIYMGTLAKVLSPSVRCAYLILPESLLDSYEERYKYYNSALPTYNQSALAQFIDDGLLEKHIRKLVLANERKYNILDSSIREFTDDKVRIFKQPSGVHTLMQIRGCINQEEMIKQMRQESIGIYGTKPYWYDQSKADEEIFLMGFNAIKEDKIRPGCKKIGEVLSRKISCIA